MKFFARKAAPQITKSEPTLPEVKSLATSVSWADLLDLSPAADSLTITPTLDDALRICAAPITVMATAAACLAPRVTERLSDGTIVDVPQHPISDLIADRVNDAQGWSELVADLMTNALISSTGGHAWVTRTPSGVLEITPFARGVVQVVTDPTTGLPAEYLVNGSPIDRANLVHLRAPTGRAPLELAKAAIAEIHAMELHAAKLFSRGGRPSGVLSLNDVRGTTAVADARKAWEAAHGGTRSGMTAVLPAGVTWQPVTLTSANSQFLEMRRFALENLARAFAIPSPMIGNLTRATWSNLESKGREFWAGTMEPWLRQIETAFTAALFVGDERGRFQIALDRDDFGQADLNTRATAINGLIASRTISPNEGRQWLGMEPRAGGDEFLNPNISELTSEGASDDA